MGCCWVADLVAAVVTGLATGATQGSAETREVGLPTAGAASACARDRETAAAKPGAACHALACDTTEPSASRVKMPDGDHTGCDQMPPG